MKRTLATLVWLALSSAASDCSTEWCTPPYDNRLEQVIECAVQGVPEEHTLKLEGEGTGPYTFLPLDGYKVTGLNRVRRQGQLRTCCGNETQVVSFDLVSEEPVVCSFYWSADGNGSLEMVAHDVKITTHLRFVVEPANDSVVEGRRTLDEYEEPAGTSLRIGGMTMNSTGISDDASTRAQPGILRLLTLAAIQDSWEELFVPKFVNALKALSLVNSS